MSIGNKAVATAPDKPTQHFPLSPEEQVARQAQWDAYDAEKAANKYKEDRKSEYPTAEELTVAMWESVVEGDSTALNALQARRLEIKGKYPKPE